MTHDDSKKVASDDLRDALSVIFGLSELKRNPYGGAARQSLSRHHNSPKYVPLSLWSRDHVPIVYPEPEHPEDLVPAEDEAPIEAYITEIAIPTRPIGSDCSSEDHNGETRVYEILRGGDDGRLRGGQLEGQLPGPWIGLRRTEHGIRGTITVFKTQARPHEWQESGRDISCLTRPYHRMFMLWRLEHSEDTLEDTGSSAYAPIATTTTSVTNAQIQVMIDQGVTAALAARDANRNCDDSHTSGTGGRRTECIVRECTYQDFMK
ncbi:hypothetical protein Tco_0474244 [Tanacetum coccineum]